MEDVLGTDEGRRALATHDIAAVYKLLKTAGVTQRQIAGMTGQSQSEISEIMKGRRVMGYDTLVRIAKGLDVPREWMGLGYPSGEGKATDYSRDDDTEELEEDVIRRRLLGLGSLALLGQSLVDDAGGLPDPGNLPTPLPDRVGTDDVRQFIAVIACLRALDRQYGGAGVYQAIFSYVRRGERLLPHASSELAHRKLAAAIADAHVLAGWSAFDAGHPDKGRAHFGRALEFSGISGQWEATASVLYTAARMEIDSAAPNEGLKLLQIAQVGLYGEDPRPVISHFIDADVGRAYAAMGHQEQAREAIRRTVYELPGEHHAADLMGITSATQASMGDYEDAAYILQDLLPQRQESAARGAAGELVRLATVCIEMGEVDKGLGVGERALATVDAVPGSARTIDRLVPLRDAAGRRRDSACQDFARVVSKNISRHHARTGP